MLGRLARPVLFVVISLMTASAAGGLAGTEDPGTVCVPDLDLAEACEASASSLQAAVDLAGDGGTVLLGEDVREQVVVDASVTIRGVDDPAIQVPEDTVTHDGRVQIVRVTGADTDATVADLTVQGPGSSSCGSLHSGVAVLDGASATVDGVHFVDVRDELRGEDLSGCQNGVGVTVGRFWHDFGGEGTGTAEIVDSTFEGFQKSAITVTGEGSAAVIAGNEMVCFDPGRSGQMSQDAVQIWKGGAVSILDNTFRDCRGPAGGAAIHLSDGVHDVLIQGNHITGADAGINFSPFTYAPEPTHERAHDVTIRQNTFVDNVGAIYNHADPAGEEVTVACNTFVGNTWGIINFAQLVASQPALTAAEDGQPVEAATNALAAATSVQATSVIHAPHNYWGSPAGPTLENKNLGPVNAVPYAPVPLDAYPLC